MPDYVLRLLEDRLTPGARTPDLAPANRMLYCAEGSVSLAAETLAANQARHTTTGARLQTGEEAAHVLRFELVPAGGSDDGVLAADGVTSRPLLSRNITLERGQDYLMRLDRVDFPLGAIAYLHTHQGPGIRCLVAGHIQVETEGGTIERDPFEAWFEGGPEPVLARASENVETAFVRAMVLPRALLGKSSISYVRAEDRDKPKRQRYTVFQDQPIIL